MKNRMILFNVLTIIIVLFGASYYICPNRKEQTLSLKQKEKYLNNLIKKCEINSKIDTANLDIRVLYDIDIPSDKNYVYKITVNNNSITTSFSKFSESKTKTRILLSEENTKLKTLASKINGYVLDVDLDECDAYTMFATISNNIIVCTTYTLCENLMRKDENIYNLIKYLEDLSPIEIDEKNLYGAR